MVLAYRLLRFTRSTGGFKPKRAGRHATWVRNTKRGHGMTKGHSLVLCCAAQCLALRQTGLPFVGNTISGRATPDATSIPYSLLTDVLNAWQRCLCSIS